MKAIAVIPARYASTRFLGKPLAKIAGKPMLQWVVEAAKKCADLNQVIVATDDQRIFDLCREISADVEMTAPELATGSDRVWSVVERIGNEACDIVVNIQGDEPLLEADLISKLIAPFKEKKNSELEMSTLARGMEKGDLENPNTAKVLLDKYSRAIYFSRHPVPYSRRSAPENMHENSDVLCHIGLYAYRCQFLSKYCQNGPCGIEENEGLEQLRALYLGAKIHVTKVEARSHGVDVPEDIAKIEELIRQRGLYEKP